MTTGFLLLTSALFSFPQEPPNHTVEAAKVLQIVDVVVAQHIDPPTRADLVRRICRATTPTFAPGLGRRLSKQQGERELLAALEAASRQPKSFGLQYGLRKALAEMWGPVTMTMAKENRIDRQVAENRYVGTGIQLAMKTRPVMTKVFEGGPAYKVGAKDGDVIESIDGKSTEGQTLRDVVDALRGPKGSRVDVTLRQPNGEPRDYTVVRGVVPLRSVSKPRWAKGREIVHVVVTGITSSTVHELRKLSSQLSENTQHVVLDLRQLHNRDLHHGQLLASALLDAKPLGAVTHADGDKVLTSEPGELFDGLRLTVVVDKQTTGTPEWIAAALQDNGRANVAGMATATSPFVNESVAGPGDTVLVMPVGWLKRIHGRTFGQRRIQLFGLLASPTKQVQQAVVELFQPSIRRNFEAKKGNRVSAAVTLSDSELRELDRLSRNSPPQSVSKPIANQQQDVGE